MMCLQQKVSSALKLVNYPKDSEKVRAKNRAFSLSDSKGEEGASVAVQAPNVAKTSSDAPMNAFMDMKRIRQA